MSKSPWFSYISNLWVWRDAVFMNQCFFCGNCRLTVQTRQDSVLWAHAKNHRPQVSVCCDKLCPRQPLHRLSCGTLLRTMSASPKPEPVVSEAAGCVYNLQAFHLPCSLNFLVRQACHLKDRVGAPLDILWLDRWLERIMEAQKIK